MSVLPVTIIPNNRQWWEDRVFKRLNSKLIFPESIAPHGWLMPTIYLSYLNHSDSLSLWNQPLIRIEYRYTICFEGNGNTVRKMKEHWGKKSHTWIKPQRNTHHVFHSMKPPPTPFKKKYFNILTWLYYGSFYWCFKMWSTHLVCQI